jgi:hypothetical protein
MLKLKELHPKIYRQIHPTLNGTLNPDKVNAGSNKKIWWQCEAFPNHFWDEAPVTRVKSGSDCLICSNKRVLEGFNDLETLKPDLAKKWHPTLNLDLKPSQIFPMSSKNIWWMCDKNAEHAWQATPANMSKAVFGCPFCSGRRPHVGVNDFASKFPQIALEWDSELNGNSKPSDFLPGSPKIVYWRCKNGHSYKAALIARRDGSSCPYCAGTSVLAGFNDIATTNPELLPLFSSKNTVLPSEVQAGSEKKLMWVCEKGHEWLAQVNSLTRGTRCPVCVNKKVIPGLNDFASRFPRLASEYYSDLNDGVPIESVRAGSKKLCVWRCQFGHTWKSTPSNRAHFDSGCPVCKNRDLHVGFNDMKSSHPNLALEFDLELNAPETPLTLIASTHKRLWWKCSQGHSWRATGNARASRNSGCPTCFGLTVLPGFNDLQTKFPDLAKEWDTDKNESLEPHSVSPGTHKKYWWKCNLGHSYEASVSNRTRLETSCPICINQQVLAGYNDLESTFPELLSEWDYSKNLDLVPSQIVARSDKKVWWICNLGHSWKTSPGVRIAVGTGCPSCAKRGYSQAKAGTFYFIQNSFLNARKVGIANQDSQRLEAWIAGGWEVIFQYKSDDGNLILGIETHVLRWIRQDIGLPPYLGPTDIGKLRGWSETFSIEGISNAEVISQIRSTVEALTVEMAK